MSMESNFGSVFLQSALTPKRHLTMFEFNGRALEIRKSRFWKRRRLKLRRSVPACYQLGPLPFESLFQDLISHFPQANSLDIIAPALGFASGVALYLSRWKTRPNPLVSDIGEWILFTSPSPFNRFVILRCPSIAFEGSDLLEDVNERFVNEDRHFVRLNSGTIQVRDASGENYVEKLVYQRLCVSAKDGGVISLDWPENLELEEEHGLDTTLLLIPGTAEGSMDINVRSFVCESLNRGYFPVVMNPRGCAGSPLTTPRLFTAADSDDVSTAIQFISKARPCTTLMGVGLGFGANMLTKYLAEVGENTPLTAATCIDNPFDLEELTRLSPYNVSINEKLTGGLIHILRSNKKLFQGRGKGFNIDKALSATSVRDFEKEISMVSYGFDAIEDFYTKSSTQGVIRNLKIPVLFIQNGDGFVPAFSIPRSSIAENPFTSLLLCSFFPSSIASSGSTLTWCKQLTLEWLIAVELGLLKGRHPLLKDVDVAVNPSIGLALAESGASNKSEKAKKLLSAHNLDTLNEHALRSSKAILRGNGTTAGYHIGKDPKRHFELKRSHDRRNGALYHSSSVDVELVKMGGAGPSDNERGHMLQTAEVVMNMLDVTMRGTLAEEQRKKVLYAVGEGETVMKALQDAVPENVREKLTMSVSEILHNQGSNLKLDGISNMSKIPSGALGLKSKVEEKTGLLSAEGGNGVPISIEQKEKVNGVVDGPSKIQTSMDKHPENQGSETQASDNMKRYSDLGHGNDASISGTEMVSTESVSTESVNDYRDASFLGEKDAQSFELKENAKQTGSNTDILGHSEKSNDDDCTINNQNKEEHNGGIVESEMKEKNVDQKCQEVGLDSSTNKNKIVSLLETQEERTSEKSLSEEKGGDNQTIEERNMFSGQNQNSPNPPSFSVTQALDALTEFDDSTQVAVNSVFNVIEDMITRLEEGKNGDIDGKTSKKVEDQKVASLLENGIIEKMTLKEGDEIIIDKSLSHEQFDDRPLDSCLDLDNELSVKSITEKPLQTTPEKDVRSQSDESSMKINNQNYAEHLDKLKCMNNSLNQIPLHIITNQPHGYPWNFLVSKVKNAKSLDLDTTTALFLDYFPEEGQWKLLDQADRAKHPVGDYESHEHDQRNAQLDSEEEYTNDVIEPTHVILDAGNHEEAVDKCELISQTNKTVDFGNKTSPKLMFSIKDIIMDSLKVEVSRRVSDTEMEEMEPDLTIDFFHIADAVCLAVGQDDVHESTSDGKDYASDKVGFLYGEPIIEAISSAVQDTRYLGKLLPVGVVVGSIFAALRKSVTVSTVHIDGQIKEVLTPELISNSREISCIQACDIESSHFFSNTNSQKCEVEDPIAESENKSNLRAPNHDTVMVGAVTAALGASALLVHQQDLLKGEEIPGPSIMSFNHKESHPEEPSKLDDESFERNQNSIVTSLAEKAMSVASPVVPTKEGGQVDQERLVAILAELGQKGGILKLVGKIALLWGGIRGAMSLTSKLISFLRIAERPLFQRILGFVGMVIVLWSPVVVPLLPTLVQGWSSHNSPKVAEFACIVGLYASIMMLVMLWGKKIRGYENPLSQYGMDFSSSLEIQSFLKGLIGGIVLVVFINLINALLGCIQLSWPTSFSSTPANPLTQIKLYGKIAMLIGQGLIAATSVALVEELLFGSWLPEEIAIDIGRHLGIIISGFSFSLFQRLPSAIPGLWLLSLALAGIRLRCRGSLALPIGIHTGILASGFILQRGHFITYHSNSLLWIAGSHSLQSFSGIGGLSVSLLLAVVFYPWQIPNKLKIKRTIIE